MNFEEFKTLNKPFKTVESLPTVNVKHIDIFRAAYSAMSEYLYDVLSERPDSASFQQLIESISRSVDSHLANNIQRGEVSSPIIPHLTHEEVQSWINAMRKRLEANRESSFRKELAVMAFAAYCYETRIIWGEAEALYQMPFPIDFLAEFDSYGFWVSVHTNTDVDFLGAQQRIEAFSAEQKKRVDSMLLAYSNKAKEMSLLFTTIEERAGALITDTVSKSAELNKSISDAAMTAAAQKATLDAEKARLDKLLSEISTAEENVQAFAKAVREEFKFDATKKLWNRRAIGSTWSFWLSALAIVFAIVGPPYWVITHVDAVVSFLRNVGDAAIHGLPADQSNTQTTIATISRLVIVSAPLALYFWAIKLIVRYNTRSMVLMDDARQRQTTMDTFFNLIENHKASPKERGLMLNALFKPLPGQGDENIEPPNFIDLISQRKS